MSTGAEFRPRVVSSYNIVQLEKVADWFGPEAVGLAKLGDYKDAFTLLDQATKDERGKPIDEKGRRRLQFGLDALILYKEEVAQGHKITGEIQAWQIAEREEAVELRYRTGSGLLDSLAMRPPSIEFRANQNTPVEDNLPTRRTIEVSDYLKKVEDTRKQIEEVQELVHDKFGAGAAPFIGMMMGSEKKVVNKPDGSQEESDWTFGDLMSEWDKESEIDEREVRRELAEEVVLAMKHQHDFFIRREEPGEYHQSEEVIECTFALLEWVMKSKDNITERYPTPGMVTETRAAAEMLEVMRRIVLRPAYYIMEGIAKSDIHPVPSYFDDFWDSYNERRAEIEAQMKDPKDTDEYQEVKARVAHENPKKYTWEEWKEILQAEMVYLQEYLEGCAFAAARQLNHRVEFFSSLTNNGQPVLPIEAGDRFTAMAQDMFTVAKDISELDGFDQVLPYIKKKYGPDATFKTLLEKLGVFPQQES